MKYVSAVPTPVPTFPSPGLTGPPEELLLDPPEFDPPPDETPEPELLLAAPSSAPASFVGEPAVPEAPQRRASARAPQPATYPKILRACFKVPPP
jgi:hypothetical protein